MRKAIKTDYGYDSTFPKRLRSIMDDDPKTTQSELAAVCGVERQSVAQWRDGNTRPDILSLEKIAKYFNVSTDYLLGIEDGTTHQATADLDALGLDEECLNIILQAKGTDETGKVAFLLKNKDKIFELIDGWENRHGLENHYQ